MKVCTKNEYYETLKPLLFILKIFGILPFVLNNKDTKCRKFATLVINVFSMIVYSIASVSSIIFIGNNVIYLMKHFNFVHFVQSSTEITLRIYVLMIPFAMWNKSCLFTEYYDGWKSVQNDLETISGIPYKCLVKRRIRWIAYCLSISMIMFPATYYFVDRKISISHRISMFLVGTISTVTLGYWYSNCVFTRHVIQIIQKHIEKAMKEEVKKEKLQKLVDVWIHVCDLIDRFNSIHSIIFLTQTVAGVTNGISNLYSAILSLISRRNENIIAGDLISFMIGVSITYMYCESANTVYDQLVHRIQRSLLTKNTSKMPLNCLKTLRSFLNTIEVRNPKIELSGVLKIDRSTFIVMLGAGVNYLIILTQFGTLYIQQLQLKNNF
ncbi:gustatory and odorant receptor 24-like [Planococcus citri]|uniref:gustatory and odorant receptor 24-like n=1 Tax=Planococcus citri TaxID=170843 RepID=UPI0031FA3C8F